MSFPAYISAAWAYISYSTNVKTAALCNRVHRRAGKLAIAEPGHGHGALLRHAGMGDVYLSALMGGVVRPYKAHGKVKNKQRHGSAGKYPSKTIPAFVFPSLVFHGAPQYSVITVPLFPACQGPPRQAQLPLPPPSARNRTRRHGLRIWRTRWWQAQGSAPWKGRSACPGGNSR